MTAKQIKTKISCQGVSKTFGGDVIALKDASFDVEEGETFVVMGLSGSGKSTLIRCISRLLEPTSGSVLIDGSDIISMSDQQILELRRHKMSMVFQHFGLFSHRCVLENVSYGLEVQGVGKKERTEKAEEVLELVGLPGWSSYYPHQLSGGMQQRIGLARALAVDPEILLFDEPFSALDPLTRRNMQEELLRLQNKMRKTMVFITHDFLEAVKLGNRIAVMKEGEILQVGTAEDIVLAPVNEYVHSFTENISRQGILKARNILKPCLVLDFNTADISSTLSQMLFASAEVVFFKAGDGRLSGVASREVLEQALQNGADLTSASSPCPDPISPDLLLSEVARVIAKTDLPVPVVSPSFEPLGYVERSGVILSLVDN